MYAHTFWAGPAEARKVTGKLVENANSKIDEQFLQKKLLDYLRQQKAPRIFSTQFTTGLNQAAGEG